MIRKKKSLLSMLALGVILSAAKGVSATSVQTEEATLSVEDIDRVEMVNVRELGQEAYKYSYMTDQEGNYRTAVVSGNGRVIEFKEQSPFVMVDGKRMPLSTTTTKGGAILPEWNDGVKFDGIDVYVPKEVVLDIFELSERGDGLVYEKEVIQVIEQPEIEEEVEFFKPIKEKQPKKEEEKTEEESGEIIPEKDEIAEERPVEESESSEDAIKEEPAESEKEEEAIKAPVEPAVPVMPEESEESKDELPKEEPQPVITESDWSAFIKEAKQKVNPLQIKEYSDGSISFDVDNKKPEHADVKQRIIAWLEEQLYVYEMKEVKTATQISVKRSLK